MWEEETGHNTFELVVLEENVLRQRGHHRQSRTRGGQFDKYTRSAAYEDRRFWGSRAWLKPLDDFGEVLRLRITIFETWCGRSRVGRTAR